MRHDSVWRTEHEVAFLRGLGLHCGPYPSMLPAHLRRVSLLRGYLAGCAGRFNWRGLDRDTVVRTAREMLSEALRGAEPMVNEEEWR